MGELLYSVSCFDLTLRISDVGVLYIIVLPSPLKPSNVFMVPDFPDVQSCVF